MQIRYNRALAYKMQLADIHLLRLFEASQLKWITLPQNSINWNILVLSFRSPFSQFLVSCAAAGSPQPLEWQDERGRKADTPSSSSPLPAPLCCGHGTRLEGLVASLRKDIWRLNVAFKAWRWQGTPQTGPILVYTQGQPQGYIWKQESYLPTPLKLKVFTGSCSIVCVQALFQDEEGNCLHVLLLRRIVFLKDKSCRPTRRWTFLTGFLFRKNNFL